MCCIPKHMYTLNKIACYVHAIFSDSRSSHDGAFWAVVLFFKKKGKRIKKDDPSCQKGTGRTAGLTYDRPYVSQVESRTKKRWL
jgi:hypothetical protein